MAPSPRLVGIVASLATGGGYLIGAGRNFTHDGGTTVGALIADRSFAEALGTTVSYNNHPAASLIGQLTWRLGGRSELVLRLPGIVAIGLAVGLLAWWLASRFDWHVAAMAALLVMSNPLVATNTRAVRGYSFMLLGIVASTLIVVEQAERARDPGPETDRASSAATAIGLLYVLTLGLAIAGHLYGGIAIVVHGLYLLGGRQLAAAWLIRMAAGTGLGVISYFGLLPVLIAGRGRSLDPSFPVHAAVQLAGGVWWVAIPLWGAALLAVQSRRNREVLYPAVGVLVCLNVLWLVVQPTDLYPRMLLFLVFPVASFAALGLRRLGPAGVGLSLVAAALSLVPQIEPWTADEMANEQAGRVVTEVAASGGSTCLVGWSAFSVWAYDSAPADLRSVTELLSCDLVVGAEFDEIQPALARLETGMDHHHELAGARSVRLFWSEAVDGTVVHALE